MKKFFPVLIVTLLMSAMGNNLFSQVNTIPAGASPYPNLGAAFTAINLGGPYAGVAVTVTITADLVEPAAATLNGGVFTSLLLRPSGIRTVTGNFNEAIIVLNGADNVTIDGMNAGGNSLTFSNTNAGTSSGSIRMSNGAENNVVRNCTCMGLGVANAQGGRTINIAQSTNGIGNNNNIIENNVVNGGRRGIQTFGTGTPSAPPFITNDNTIIRNNIVKNVSAIHIFLGSETIGNTATGNDIFNDAAVNGTDQPIGILLQGVGMTNISTNRIHNISYTTFAPPAAGFRNGLFGIFTRPLTLTAPGSNATTVDIINNFVAYTDNNDPAAFIYGVAPLSSTAGTPYTANVFNNSAHIGGTSAPTIVQAFTAALEVDMETAGSVANIANNIAINSRTGGDVTSFHIGDDESSMPFPGVTFNTDYNFSKATDTTGTGWDGGYAGRVFRGNGGLESMKDTACIQGNGQHNMYKMVNFVSPTNLHLAGPIGGDMCGKPLAQVSTDIDGQPRNSTYPYRGADEGPAFKLLTVGGCLEGVASTDQITVVLRTGACGIVASGTADLISGTAVFCFGDSVQAGPYYIDVQNRNHLETYSASAIPFGANTIYDFRPARATAFGSNLTAAGPPFCFYGGDRNGDGNVNLADLLAVYNDATAFVNGCRKVSDIDNNGFVNLQDILITGNNNTSFVVVNKPCPGPSSISTFNNNDSRIEKDNNKNLEIINKIVF